jgi:asparagine synthase (glutamine-hydrolysing)
MNLICGSINLHGETVGGKPLERFSFSLDKKRVDRQSSLTLDDFSFGCHHVHLSPESSTEEQPSMYKDLCLISDARLFNREVLCKELGVATASAKEISDPLLILYAYEKWGHDCVNHLDGEFAFVIWDRLKKEAYIARDHYGSRFLFYYLDKHQFHFASEAKALFSIPGFSPNINEQWLVSYCLKSHHLSAGMTPFEKINLVKKASYMVLSANNQKETTYWNPKPKDKIRFKNDSDYAERLLELMTDSVESRIRTPHGVGLALSGGLDSSSIGAIASKILLSRNEQLFANGITLPDKYTSEEDDENYIDLFAMNSPNIALNKVVYDSTFDIGTAKEHAQSLLLPGGKGHISWNTVFENIKESNAKLLLTGFFGDDLVSKPKQLIIHEMFHEKRFFSLIPFLFQKNSPLTLPVRNSIKYELKKGVKSLFRTEPDKDYTFLVKLLNPSFATKHDIAFRLEEKQRLDQKYTVNEYLQSSWEAYTYFKSSYSTTAQGMLHGVHVSHPMIDRKLFDFCSSIPVEKFLLNGQNRGLIREAMHGVLPEKIRLRHTKGRFAKPSIQQFRDEIDTNLEFLRTLPPNSPARTYLDIDYAIELGNCFRRESQEKYRFIFSKILTLVVFIEEFYS